MASLQISAPITQSTQIYSKLVEGVIMAGLNNSSFQLHASSLPRLLMAAL